MLYIFDVCLGEMQALDMHLLTAPVHQLQQQIYDTTGVTISNQVLLASGGCVLEGDKPVSFYGAGTDNNPIFLVSKVNEHKLQQTSHGPEQLKCDFIAISDQFSSIITKSPANLESIQRICASAKQSNQLSEQTLELCSRFVHEQHLLHQGWNALVAHLDDTSVNFIRRAKRFKETREQFIDRIQSAQELLDGFASDMTLLDQMPIAENILGEEKYNELVKWIKKSREIDEKALEENFQPSLLDWICASDPESQIHELPNDARNLIEALQTPSCLVGVEKADSVEQSVNNEAMKEIKGINNRLKQLDEGLRKAEDSYALCSKQISRILDSENVALKETREAQNLGKIRDGQKTQWAELENALETLLAIAKKFSDSKTELLENIGHRISNWIVSTHHEIYMGSNQLYIYGERLSQVKKRLELIRQIHEAPAIYAHSVSEVLRRQRFSKEFGTWSQNLVEQMQKLRKEEGESRSKYKEKMSKHFLRALFVGMSDNMPDFACDRPTNFDDRMLNLNAETLRNLRDKVSPLRELLQVSQPRIFEKLTVNDPSGIYASTSTPLRREASFFTYTPPKLLPMNARSIPSFAWMSGDENLASSPSPGSKMGFVNLGIANQQQSQILNEEEKNMDECGDINVQDCEKDENGVRSAPIRIPSRAPSDGMSSSRQISEKSSRFGTPEQDMPMLDPASLEDMATSPPEFVSSSALNYEINQMTQEIVNKVDSWNSNSNTATNSSTSGSKILDENRFKRLAEILTEVKNIKMEIDETKALAVANSEAGSSTIILDQDFIEKLRSLISNVEMQISEKQSKPLLDEIKSLKAQFENEKRENYEILEVERQKCEDLEKQIDILEMWIKEKQEFIDNNKSELEFMEKKWAEKVKEAEKEILKQLTIEHELEIDDEREQNRVKIQARESEIDELKSRLIEKESTIRLMHSEQDKLVAVVCENRASPVGSPSAFSAHFTAQNALETSIHVQKQTRNEVEREFKSKLALLTQGLVDDKRRIKERFVKEKEYELRMAQEASNVELEKVRMKFEEEIAELKEKIRVEEMRKVSVEIRNVTPQIETNIMTQSVPGESFDSGNKSNLMTASCIAMSESVMNISQVGQVSQEDSSASATSSSGNNKVCQTRLRLKDMKTLISMGEVREGDTVLVVWNEDHQAFSVFTTSNILYFVKKTNNSSLTFDSPIESQVSNQRKYVAVVKIVKCEFCQITKSDNRYSLQMGTKFYRVEVEKLQNDPSDKLAVKKKSI